MEVVKQNSLRAWLRRSLWVVGGLLVAGLAAGAVYLASPAPLLPEASAALKSTALVAYSEANGWLTYTPVGTEHDTGLIFYPGGRVPPAGYGPAAQAIAGQGFLVVIVPMPLNLAVFGIERASDVIAAHPEIRHWAIGGHSLGGAMAAQYVANHPGAVQGLLFWASYAAGDLSGQTQLKVMSVYGSLETGKPTFISATAKAHVPAASATYVEIPGGNHEQFGYYTGQPNDPPAQIARQEQQFQAAAAAMRLLQSIAAP